MCGMTATCSGYLMPVGESQGHVREGSSLVDARSRISFFFGYCIVRGLVVNKRSPVQISVTSSGSGREALREQQLV